MLAICDQESVEMAALPKYSKMTLKDGAYLLALFLLLDGSRLQSRRSLLIAGALARIELRAPTDIKAQRSLENNPKQIRTLIGLKPCFYNSVETQNKHELLTYDGANKENLHFDDRSKQVVFLFRYFLK